VRLSVVVIGRNEGKRLVRCLESVMAMRLEGGFEVIYVDSGSSDDSIARARAMGARVLEVASERPTAALGRNTGLAAVTSPFVFFLDGDTILSPEFAAKALARLEAEPQLAVVCGHRRETAPEKSIYNRVLDLDWQFPPGEARYCGGDAIMRTAVLAEVGAFRVDLIAGEEPELCHRIRRAGYHIRHLDLAMTGHDLNITSFRAYWLRCFRAGHGYAEVAARTGGETFGRESRRNLIQTIGYLVVPLLLVWLLQWWGLVVAGIGALLVIARTAWRARRRGAGLWTTLAYAVHSHICQFPIWFGQIRYLRRKGGRLIEYK